jgi:membrane protein
MARLGHRLVSTARIAAGIYARAAGGQHAAAISYHVCFSLVPFVALFLSVLEVVLPEATAERVVSWLVDVLPLPADLSRSVVGAVERSAPPASAAGLIAAAGLLWAAGGMMGSVRAAFRAVWASEADEPFLRGKALDLVLVLGTGVLIVAAFGVSVVVQLVTDRGTRIVDDLGGSSSATARLSSLGQLTGSTVLAFLAFLLLYRVVPPVATRLRDTAPAAAVAAVAVQLATAGFSIYLERVADFDEVYGPLGAVFALLLLVYVVSAILLFGACLAAAPRPPAVATVPAGVQQPLRTRILQALRALVVRDRS